MASLHSHFKTRVLSVVVCCALLIGALAVVEIAAAPTVAAAARHPSITASPNPVTSANCASGSITGKNFVGGGNTVTIYLDGTPFGAGADVAPDGTFHVSEDFCSVPVGKHTVTVVSTDGLTARTSLRVK